MNLTNETKTFEKRFQKFAWTVLAVNLLVILWGAYVRATGSGAGCGGNWPLCNGEVVPPSRAAETLIEYTHRITSGVALILTLSLAYLSRRFPPERRVRKAAVASGVFIIIEALIGAGLVLFELVGGNTSVMRAVASAVHLTNTYLLIGAITLTARWASTERDVTARPGKARTLAITAAVIGMLLIGASGAITALGDTLFPAQSLAAGISEELSAGSHFLVRLRIIHPLISILIGAFILFGIRLNLFVAPPGQGSRDVQVLIALIFIQWLAGGLNVLLLAPIWMQILHLLLADLIWIAFILYLERRIFVINHPSSVA